MSDLSSYSREELATMVECQSEAIEYWKQKGKEYRNHLSKIANLFDYPSSWDRVAFPTLYDAINHTVNMLPDSFKVDECGHNKPKPAITYEQLHGLREYVKALVKEEVCTMYVADFDKTFTDERLELESNLYELFNLD